MTEAQVKAMSIAFLIVLDVGKKSRNKYAHAAKVPWSQLDALADALREAGAEGVPDNLGAEAAAKVQELIERGKQQRDDAFGYQGGFDL